MERLILDTGVLVAVERGAPLAAAAIPADADIALAAITASELLVGVLLADPPRRDARQALVDDVLETFDVIAFDADIARHHAELLAHTRAAGQRRGAHDLQIAATARATGRTVITTDRDDFEGLPGVSYQVLDRNG